MRYQKWLNLHGKPHVLALAEAFGVTAPAVYQWGDNGVPVGRMAGVESFIKKACPKRQWVTVAEMVAESAELRVPRVPRFGKRAATASV